MAYPIPPVAISAKRLRPTSYLRISGKSILRFYINGKVVPHKTNQPCSISSHELSAYLDFEYLGNGPAKPLPRAMWEIEFTGADGQRVHIESEDVKVIRGIERLTHVRTGRTIGLIQIMRVYITTAP